MNKIAINTNFRINNFIYHELPSGELVIQTKVGIVKVSNQSMINFIKEIDDQQKYRTVPLKLIEDYFGEYTSEAITFLNTYKILKMEEPFNYKVKGINFFSNSSKFLDLTKIILNDTYDKNGFSTYYSNSIEDLILDDQIVWCCFLNPYDRGLAKKIVEACRANKNILLMSYVYNGSVYVDNLYSSKWKNPCHFCNMGHLESQLRVQKDGNLTYQHIVDMVNQEDSNFKVELNLNNIEIMKVISVIIDIIEKFFIRSSKTMRFNESFEDINYCTLIDFNNQTVTKDIGIHWELCDCYE